MSAYGPRAISSERSPVASHTDIHDDTVADVVALRPAAPLHDPSGAGCQDHRHE